MKTIEYRTYDKSGWQPGPWMNEPDKKQWQDPETGLPCLIVRGPVGAWCGYVGVGKDHPWFGKDYTNLSLEWDDPERQKTPEAVIRVHGGLTFADECHAPSPEGFERMKKRVQEAREDAKKHPIGDSARWLKTWEPLLGDYKSYAEHVEATAICHKTDDGDKVWWFGFDTSHLDDYAPAMDSDDYRLIMRGLSRERGTYRDQAYVEAEVTSLAKQLAAVK